MSHDAFLRAILDNPNDDGPRLVYADWLDERGDADRAEFIRVQCELARLSEDDPRRPELAQREQFLSRHRYDWVGPNLRWANVLIFSRGFPYLTQATPPQFLANGAAWFASAPTLEALSLLDAGGQVATITNSPLLERLTWLGFLFSPDFQPADLGGAPTTAVPGRFDDHLHLADIQALAHSPCLGRLRGLGLRNCRLGNDHLALLLSSWGEQLTQLDLSGNSLGDTAINILTRTPRLRNLMWLDLSRNHIGPDGATALARSPNLTNLTRLDLSRNRIGGTLGQALGRFWTGSGITPGVRALTDPPLRQRLVWLNLRRNRLSREDIELLRSHFGDRVRL